ncbi:MAG: DinB family protein [Vicinamibacteria bacterium]|nr:DinB family protein [Vicinamibacteria bacterium]
MAGLPADLAQIVDELAALTPRARTLLAPLSDEALNAPPAAGSWSVALCLEHLVVGARVYLAPMRMALERGRAEGRLRRGPLTPGLPSRLFLRQLEPPVKLKTPTLDVIRPPQERAERDALLERFAHAHEAAIALLVQSADLDLGGIRFRNPLVAWLPWTTGVGFRILAAHGRRHLWQAEQVVARARLSR